MKDGHTRQKICFCAHCGREIKSRREILRGRQDTLCSQCYRELAFGDLRAKQAEFRGRT